MLFSVRESKSFNSVSPCPVTDDTGTIGASSSRVPRVRILISSSTSWILARRNQIGFRNSEDRHLHAEQVDDIQVFFGLGHDAVIGGDGEENQIDAVRAGEHVFDEALVARDIDDARLRSVGKIKMSKPQINGDAAFLFFLQAVCILSGQCFDQAGFSVIDVAGGTDDVGHIEFSSKFRFNVQRADFGAVQILAFNVQGWDVGTLNLER